MPHNDDRRKRLYITCNIMWIPNSNIGTHNRLLDTWSRWFVPYSISLMSRLCHILKHLGMSYWPFIENWESSWSQLWRQWWHSDNIRCHQRRQRWYNDDSRLLAYMYLRRTYGNLQKWETELIEAIFPFRPQPWNPLALRYKSGIIVFCCQPLYAILAPSQYNGGPSKSLVQ